MTDRIDYFFGAIILALLILVLAMFSLIYSFATMDRAGLCQERWPSRETRHSGGVCLVLHNGEFVPESAIRLSHE